MAETERVATTVPLDWNEVWFTNCPMVSANNVDQELGWCREEFKKIGVEYAYFRHAPENDWYPHYIHNLDNLIRFGGLLPADPRPGRHPPHRLLGATWVYEGGCMAVRARDDIFRMKDLKGKKIGLSKSLNTIKNDWWRIQEHMGIENMLMLNDMTHGRRGDRRVPLPGRLVRQARDARSADEQPVRAVDAPRPQARPGVPPAGDRAARAATSTRSTPRARSSSTCRRRRARSR